MNLDISDSLQYFLGEYKAIPISDAIENSPEDDLYDIDTKDFIIPSNEICDKKHKKKR